MNILKLKNLSVVYHTDQGIAPATRSVSLNISKGERLGLVGESGSGKSTLAAAILGMIRPPGAITQGDILFNKIDMLNLSPENLRQIRGKDIGVIPQGALNSLNPVLRVSEHLADTMIDHGVSLSKPKLYARIEELLQSVGLDTTTAQSYPHELSGGMKQRVCIAIAMALKPKFIIADEPTSALDVVTQKQVMETFAKLQQKTGSAIMLIGHDMGLMAQFVERIAVMYAGQLLEVNDIAAILQKPLHPYTQALIESLPSFDKHTLAGIPGVAPSLYDLPIGCVYSPRCAKVMDICKQKAPVCGQNNAKSQVACHLYN